MTTDPKREAVEKAAHDWLIGGGGGHEDGEDGLRAITVTGVGLIDFLASYAEYLQAALASPSQPSACPNYYNSDGSLKWTQPCDVGHLIRQLQTLDPKMKVSSVSHVRLEGKTKARAFGLSMSRERWGEAGWLDYKRGGPECLAIWAEAKDESVDGIAPPATVNLTEEEREDLRKEFRIYLAALRDCREEGCTDAPDEIHAITCKRANVNMLTGAFAAHIERILSARLQQAQAAKEQGT